MGGCGSGRHHGVRKRRVESCVALDVNELRRKGVLTPGASGTLTWERDCSAAGSVGIRADTAELILCYRAHSTEDFKLVEQRVALSLLPAALGDTRAYFLCPDAECGRRVSVLYFCKGVFRCRNCHGLAYESQGEDASRLQFRGVTFRPGEPKVVNECLNLWQGWGVAPKPGDWGLIRQHIEVVLAGGNEEFANYIIRWIAWAIQNPAAPAEVALVLIGEKGAGKGTLVRCLQRIFGAHAFQVTSREESRCSYNIEAGSPPREPGPNLTPIPRTPRGWGRQ
jgi:ABC-type multidrug transport system fused ATPase/permease subunit